MVKQPEFNTGGRGSSGKSLFRTNISGFPSCAPSQEQSLWLQAFHLKRIIGAETVLFFHVCSKRRLWTGWKMLRVN